MKYFIKEYDTRYFAGIEFPNGLRLNTDDKKKIPEIWDRFFKEENIKITNKEIPYHYIGLEIYPFDFMETKIIDYFVLAETSGLFEGDSEIVTKKLKKGKYICFPIKHDDISKEIHRVYEYIEEEKINVHMGYDYEDYIPDENYEKEGAILNFCFLMENDS